MTTASADAPPVADPFAGEQPVCPACGHDAPGTRDWLARLLRSRPACPTWETSAESGLGFPGECFCKHPFHA